MNDSKVVQLHQEFRMILRHADQPSVSIEEQVLINHIVNLNESEYSDDPICEEIEVWHTLGIHTQKQLDDYIAPMEMKS